MQHHYTPHHCFIINFFRFLFGLLLSNSLFVKKLKIPLSYRCLSFNFLKTFGISCSRSAWTSAFFHLPLLVSFPPMCRPILITVFSLLILNTMSFLLVVFFPHLIETVQSIHPLSIEVKKRTKIGSGNPCGRTGLYSWGRRHTARRGAGGCSAVNLGLTASLQLSHQWFQILEDLFHILCHPLFYYSETNSQRTLIGRIFGLLCDMIFIGLHQHENYILI